MRFDARLDSMTGDVAGTAPQGNCPLQEAVPQPSLVTDAPERPLAGRSVLMIAENLPVPFDRRVWQEARALRDAGATVSVICPAGKNYPEGYVLLEGVHVYRHPLSEAGSSAVGYLREYASALWHELRLAIRIFKTRGFDVIHGCNPPDLIFIIALIFKVCGRKFIFDHHDINPELYESKFNRRGFFWHLLCWAEWLTFKTADVVISTNESYRQIALGRGDKRPEDVFVVRSGPDLSRVKSVEPDPDLRNGRRFLVGYVGVLGEQEGIDLLLEAVGHIVRHLKRTDIQFYVVGGGPSLERLKALSRDMQLEDYVTFTGRVPDALLFKVLSTSDVCVNPDRVNAMNDKSTMNKILEYMALGKPIVQFELTEGRYSAQDASLYAKPNDPIDFAQKILQLLADPDARARMSANGRRRIETELAWSYEVPKLLSAYLRADPKKFGVTSRRVKRRGKAW
jgi:glycosyltransferase involved in cell wall biosynthesis